MLPSMPSKKQPTLIHRISYVMLAQGKGSGVTKKRVATNTVLAMDTTVHSFAVPRNAHKVINKACSPLNNVHFFSSVIYNRIVVFFTLGGKITIYTLFFCHSLLPDISPSTPPIENHQSTPIYNSR